MFRESENQVIEENPGPKLKLIKLKVAEQPFVI